MSKKQKRIEWVKQFESGRRWLDGVAADHTGSEETQGTYARHLYNFCRFVGKDPDQLIAERKEQLKSEDPIVRDRAENMVRSFTLKVQKETTKQNARSNHAAIRSFYKYNRYPLQIRMPKAVFRRIEPLTFEELKLIDDAADERERLIIRFLKDSGMSVDDVADITYGHIRRDFEKGEQFIHLNVIRKKEQIRYETFVGPNTVKAIKVWLKIRRHRGEKITDDSPLFTTVTGRRKLTKRAIRAIVERAGKRVGVKASTHRLRKFFDTYMALTVRSPAILRYWMGHSVVGSDIEARYVIPPEPEQRKLYAQAYSKINLMPAADLERRVAEIEKNQERLPTTRC